MAEQDLTSAPWEALLAVIVEHQATIAQRDAAIAELQKRITALG